MLVDGKIVYRTNQSPNGIVPTLKGFFNRLEAGAGAWVAWKTYDPDKGVDFERVVQVEDAQGNYTVSRLPLTAAEVESFYHVTSKEALWPILHSFPRLFEYVNVDWETFREVNRRFAEVAAAEVADDGLVWIHDYNLWLVPAYLRKLKPDVRIAFFHHTPFPGPDVFNVLPWAKEIIDSLFDCDLVGFHIPRYAKNFADVARGKIGAEVRVLTETPPEQTPVGMALSEPEYPSVLTVGDRSVRLSVAPVGADTDLVDSLLATEASRSTRETLIQELDGRRLLMTVGRTDYTKGMIESLLAYERLLERRPELIDKVKMLVTSVRAASSMKIYEQTQREIEELVGRINGRFSRLNWTPVVLFSNAVPFERLVAYYCVSDICVTTPLRDGLNLVAKEYVAAKQGGRGVLVLSEFAGCAVEMPDALLTNPFSNRAMDLALDTALDLPDDEARMRMERMNEAVRRNNVGHWADLVAQQFDTIPSPGVASAAA